MATSDFATFLTALQTALVIDSVNDTDWPHVYPFIIQDAELMIYRDLDPTAIDKTATTTATFGVPNLTVPADMVVLRELSYYTPAGGTGTRVQLQRRSITFIRDYWPVSANTAPPIYFTQEGGGIFVAPTFDAAYTVEMFYVSRPVPFSISNTPTYLSNFYPDLLFFASMLVGSGYLKNYGAASDDPQQAMSWKGLYDGALASAKIEEQRRKSEQNSRLSTTLPSLKENT